MYVEKFILQRVGHRASNHLCCTSLHCKNHHLRKRLFNIAGSYGDFAHSKPKFGWRTFYFLLFRSFTPSTVVPSRQMQLISMNNEPSKSTNITNTTLYVRLCTRICSVFGEQCKIDYRMEYSI